MPGRWGATTIWRNKITDNRLISFRRLPNQGKYATCIEYAAYSYIGDIRRGENQFAEAILYYEKAITLYGEQTISGAFHYLY